MYRWIKGSYLELQSERLTFAGFQVEHPDVTERKTLQIRCSLRFRLDGRNPTNQLVDSLLHYLHGFVHPRWCRISSINSMNFQEISVVWRLGWSHYHGGVLFSFGGWGATFFKQRFLRTKGNLRKGGRINDLFVRSQKGNFQNSHHAISIRWAPSSYRWTLTTSLNGYIDLGLFHPCKWSCFTVLIPIVGSHPGTGFFGETLILSSQWAKSHHKSVWVKQI